MEIFTTIGIVLLAGCMFIIAYVIEKLSTRQSRLEITLLVLEKRILELEKHL